MVSSLDGRASAGGKASPIGSRADRTVMRSLRARADAVMIGAGTLRAEKLRLDVPADLAEEREARGENPQPLAVVATSSGDLTLENLINPSPNHPLILAPEIVPRDPLANLSKRVSEDVDIELIPVEATGTRLNLTEALMALKKRRAIDTLLVEGGPSLNHTLILNDLADELFLTLAPRLLGGERLTTHNILEGPSLPGGYPDAKLLSAHLSESELFLRYALSPDKRTRPRGSASS